MLFSAGFFGTLVGEIIQRVEMRRDLPEDGAELLSTAT